MISLTSSLSLKLFLNSLVYDRIIFGSSSKIFGNIRKMFGNVRATFGRVLKNEGLPGVLGNKGTKGKYRREQGNMTPVLGNAGT